jgi:TolB protein
MALLAGLVAGCSEHGSPTAPSYTPKERLLYSTTESGNRERIVSYDFALATGKVLIDSARLSTQPRFGSVAYLVESATTDIFRIFAANIDGSNRHVVASSAVLAGAVSYPALSPDGSKVVYSTSDGRLLIQGSSGTDLETTLSSNAAFETIAAFSPDGKRIAFYGDDDKLYMVNIDGGSLHKVADSSFDSPGGVSQLEWSPDGARIVYIGQNNSGAPDIFVINADGTGKTQLTDDLEYDLLPTWSPDGRKIAYTHSSPGGGSIMVINATGGTPATISGSGGDNIFPSWSPDGNHIV